ncbi:NAD(P)/FAD-dependent oxidoreductase [Streptomyces sp. AJS327]|uniref:NAD(P)/FAD-dependent oxidoreductase n=1 Tax=Streptomyces sp. AJS327 TaxID=2545265 RepID=UPI0015DF341E|nr:NAD(P)/FAD-dependent oxidoreductase [Streptomyces sp. AJS327]MBA0050972.1 NAD(P)/FAD-dependent oxidoreductase [Streptomyces sp. AJS327]
MYDVIVVGARVSGAATALLLARRGHRVLLLDRASFPSPTSSSTNLIHPPGVQRLSAWGVLDRLAERTGPPITRYRLQTGPVRLEAPLPEVEGVGYALSPPRLTLDEALVRCAVEAGAELREGVSVQELRRDADGTVTGVTGVAKGAGRFTERAALVVGADGKNSTVARLAGARAYRDEPVLSKSSWTYWEGLPHEGLVRTYRDGRRHPFTWPTHDGLTIVGTAWPADRFPARTSAEETDRTVLDAFERADPEFAERLRATRRADRWLTGAVPNFLRVPHGPGWALTGDAGATRDPITASGITYGLLGAELLAEAAHSALAGQESMDRTLARYARERDLLMTDHYDYTRDYARVAEHSPEERALIGAMSRSPRHARDMIGLFATALPPARFYTRAGFRDLFDYLDDDAGLPPRIRLLRLLLHGPPSPLAAAPAALADRLLARGLGPMGQLLLRSRRPQAAPPRTRRMEGTPR